jgi:hypothetical protein
LLLLHLLPVKKEETGPTPQDKQQDFLGLNVKIVGCIVPCPSTRLPPTKR